jgi:F-type H+-transporting ATPase subunit b
MGIFSFEPGLAIWTWVAFGLLMFIMSKYVFPVLIQNLKEREKAISDSVDNADAIKKRLDDIEIEHEKIIAEARKKSDSIIIEARKNADVLKKELLQKAEKEASAVLEEAKERINEERKMAMASMKKDIVEMICEGSEKVIGHAFLKDADKKWTEGLVDDI